MSSSMSSSSANPRCPGCGLELPANAPQGLCPKCLLLEVAASTQTGLPSGQRPPPPSLDLIQAAFPHLEIVEFIGQGGMGTVYKARQPKLNRYVALKILPEGVASRPAFADRFEREGQLLARLHHPNIVTVHDFGQANGFYYLLMEFVDGVNLRQAMQAGRFTPEQALAIVPMICEALQYAHEEGVLHRDIKPENILLDTKGRVRLVDFGVAKLADMPDPGIHPPPGGASPTPALTQSGSALGTPNYMAPEQQLNPATVDQRADIYSLGVVFYEMLTGELPHGRFPPPSRKTPLDPRVDDVVMRALARQKEQRFQTAEEVKTSVETILMAGSVAQPSQFSLPAAARGSPIPLGWWPRTGLTVGLLMLLGLILNEVMKSFHYLLPQVWWTMRVGWVQGAVMMVGIGGIGWVGFEGWRRRHWLMAPLWNAAGWSSAAGIPGTPSHQAVEDDIQRWWLPVIGTAVVAGLCVNLVWILLGQLTMLAQGVAAGNVALCLYVLIPAVLTILLAAWLVRHELRRQELQAPTPPPAWMHRLALLALVYALITSAPMPSGNIGDNVSIRLGYGEFMVMVSLALWTRSRIWRALAMTLLIQSLVLGTAGLVNFGVMSIKGQ
jgi:tRNA A-37 threonylcarbamoyl transferase component Bud32